VDPETNTTNTLPNHTKEIHERQTRTWWHATWGCRDCRLRATHANTFLPHVQDEMALSTIIICAFKTHTIWWYIYIYMHMDLPKRAHLLFWVQKNLKFFRPMMSKDNLYRTENLPVHSTYHVLVALPILFFVSWVSFVTVLVNALSESYHVQSTHLKVNERYCSYAYNYHCGQVDTPWHQTVEMNAFGSHLFLCFYLIC
jgi:hypothetical protein